VEGGLARIPGIAPSANVMQGEAERCIEAGIDDFIAQPTTVSFLAYRLRRQLLHIAWPKGEPLAELRVVYERGDADGLRRQAQPVTGASRMAGAPRSGTSPAASSARPAPAAPSGGMLLDPLADALARVAAAAESRRERML